MSDEIARALACILPVHQGGLGLFKRYEIPSPLGVWRALTGPHLPTVVFLYQWDSAAARARAFTDFYEDDEWKNVRAASNDGSEIVDRIDDLLLEGAPMRALPTNGVFEFARTDLASRNEFLHLTMRPLCGENARPLVLAHYPSLEETPPRIAGTEGPRLLCERVSTGALT